MLTVMLRVLENGASLHNRGDHIHFCKMAALNYTKIKLD